MKVFWRFFLSFEPNFTARNCQIRTQWTILLLQTPICHFVGKILECFFNFGLKIFEQLPQLSQLSQLPQLILMTTFHLLNLFHFQAIFFDCKTCLLSKENLAYHHLVGQNIFCRCIKIKIHLQKYSTSTWNLLKTNQ